MIGRDFNLFETPGASANPFAQVVNRTIAKKPQIELSKIPNAPLIATKDWKGELATTVPGTQGFGALGGGRIATEPEIEKINAFAEAIKTDNPEYSVLPPEKNKGLVEAFIQDNPEYSSIFQSKEPEQRFIGGLADKTKESFMSGINRIGEAGVGLAEGKYDVGEAGIRGAAGALESAFSPIAGALGQGIESFVPDSTKESVGGTLAPVIERGSEIYSNLSPEAQRLVGNLGVAGEVGLNFLGVGAAGKVAGSEVSKTAVKKTGKVLAKGATATGRGVGKVGGVISTIPEYGVEVATGLSKEAQQVIKRAPIIYKKARTGEITRNTIFDETKSALDKRLDDLSELGRSYKDLRTGKVVGSSDDLRNAYAKSVQSVDILDLPTVDRNAIAEAKKYIDEIQGDLTDRQLLAMRKKIDSTISWDKKVGSEGQAVVRGIRAEVDNLAKSKIAGLAERDAKFAPEIKFLNTVRNSIYDAKGNVKDNAISAINSLTGKGKEFKIDRFEQILPGITQKIDALKAFEEVQGISGMKTGSILRQGGGLVAGTTALGPIGAVLGFILTHPGIAARVLEAYGMAKSAISDVLAKRASKSINDQALKIIKTAKLSEVERIIIKQNPSGLRREPIASKIGGIAKKLDMSKNRAGFINPGKIAEDLGATKANNSTKALMEEARKYKSAEEFVKAQETLYHGTQAVKIRDYSGIENKMKEIYKKLGQEYKESDSAKIVSNAEELVSKKSNEKLSKVQSQIDDLQELLSRRISKPSSKFAGLSNKDVTDNSLGSFLTPDRDFATRFTYDISYDYSGRKTIHQKNGYLLENYFSGKTLDLSKVSSPDLDFISKILGMNKNDIVLKLKTKGGTKEIQKKLAPKKDIISKEYDAVSNYAYDDQAKKWKKEIAVINDKTLYTKSELTNIYNKSKK